MAPHGASANQIGSIMLEQTRARALAREEPRVRQVYEQLEKLRRSKRQAIACSFISAVYLIVTVILLANPSGVFADSSESLSGNSTESTSGNTSEDSFENVLKGMADYFYLLPAFTLVGGILSLFMWKERRKVLDEVGDDNPRGQLLVEMYKSGQWRSFVAWEVFAASNPNSAPAPFSGMPNVASGGSVLVPVATALPDLEANASGQGARKEPQSKKSPKDLLDAGVIDQAQYDALMTHEANKQSAKKSPKELLEAGLIDQGQYDALMANFSSGS